MCLVQTRGGFWGALHIPVRCIVLHRFLMPFHHWRIFGFLRLGIESIMVSIPEETIEGELFRESGDYLCLTDVLSPRSNDAISATADGGRNRRYVGDGWS